MTTAPTMPLTDVVRFLISRIDDDGAELRRQRRDAARGASTDQHVVVALVERQLAELEAKRNILGQAQQLLLLRDLPADKPVREAAAQILREMALPYSAHRAYRPEWRPRR